MDNKVLTISYKVFEELTDKYGVGLVQLHKQILEDLYGELLEEQNIDLDKIEEVFVTYQPYNEDPFYWDLFVKHYNDPKDRWWGDSLITETVEDYIIDSDEESVKHFNTIRQYNNEHIKQVFDLGNKMLELQNESIGNDNMTNKQLIEKLAVLHAKDWYDSGYWPDLTDQDVVRATMVDIMDEAGLDYDEAEYYINQLIWQFEMKEFLLDDLEEDFPDKSGKIGYIISKEPTHENSAKKIPRIGINAFIHEGSQGYWVDLEALIDAIYKEYYKFELDQDMKFNYKYIYEMIEEDLEDTTSESVFTINTYTGKADVDKSYPIDYHKDNLRDVAIQAVKEYEIRGNRKKTTRKPRPWNTTGKLR